MEELEFVLSQECLEMHMNLKRKTLSSRQHGFRTPLSRPIQRKYDGGVHLEFSDKHKKVIWFTFKLFKVFII